MEIAKILLMKISYKTMSPTYTSLTLSLTGIKLNAILTEVNSFIVKNAIDDFLDIEIKTQGSWKNILDVFGHAETTAFMVENINDQLTIEIRLVKSSEKQTEEEIFKNWKDKIAKINKKSDQIYKKVMRDVQKVEDDSQIDLAFFYSQPISVLKDGKYFNTRKEVSFKTETRKIFDKLNPQSHTFQRSANIQIAVATRQNICKALSKGVKILHFSCHGSSEGLQVELQGEKIGLADLISCQALLQILLQYKLPEIIVFNSCHSDGLAQEIYNKFEAVGKHIATVGYENKVLDSVCDDFSQKFYFNIFSGDSIGNSVNVLKNNKQIKIFYKFDQLQKKIAFSASKISEHNKMLEIKNKTQIDQIGITFPKDNLFKFVNQLMSQQRLLFNLVGPNQVGKTQFTKKSLSYLWQRNHIYNFLIIDLRQSDHEISNIIQFRCKLERELKNTDILQKSEQEQLNYIVTIDHCDSLLKYQHKQLKKTIKNLMDRLKSKIVLVSRSKIDQHFQTYDLTSKYMESWKGNSDILIQKNKPSSNPNYAEFSMRQFVQNCYSFIYSSFSRLPKQFLCQIPYVSLFPGFIYEHENFQREDLQKLAPQIEYMHVCCQDAVKKMKKQVQFIISQQGSKELQKLRQILLQMYLTAGAEFLIDYFISKPQPNLTVSPEYKPRILGVIYRLYDICLIADQIEQWTVVQAFRIFRLKLIFLLYHFIASEEDDGEIINILIESVEGTELNAYAQRSCKCSIKQLIECTKICQALYKVDNSRSSISIFGPECKNYLQTIKQMQKQFECPSFIDLQRDENCSVLWDKFTFFQMDQVYMLRLPLLAMLKQEIIVLIHLNQEPDRQKVRKIGQLINKYEFLKEKRFTLFSGLYSYFYETYLSVIFQFKKFKLGHPKIFRKINKLQTIDKINSWVECCQTHGYHLLQNQIQNYRNQVFNIMVALISSPINKEFRFQSAVPDLLKQVYRTLDKQFLLKIDHLTNENIMYYNSLKLTIPISLFLVDAKTSAQMETLRRKDFKKKQVYLCLQKLNNLEQNIQYLQVKKLHFFPCQVAIFFGDSVREIQNEKIHKNARAIIYIDTSQEKKQKGKSLEDQVKDKIEAIARGLIAKEFLTIFYSSFCKSMFGQESEQFLNRVQQIEKSFQTAKMLAKLTCLFKLGGYYEEIKTLWDKVTLTFTNKQSSKLLLPLKIIKKTERFKVDEQRIETYTKIKKKIERSKTQIISSIDQNSEVGYQSQISKIMFHIFSYLQKKEVKSEKNEKNEMKQPEKISTKYIILVCKNQEEETLINNIYARLKRLINVDIKFISHRSVRKKSTDSYHSISESHPNSKFLGIMDLTGLDIDAAEKTIQQKYDQEQYLQDSENYSITKVMIFVLKEYPLFSQNPELAAKMEKIVANKLQNQNIVPFIVRKMLMQKIQTKEYSRNWQANFVNKLGKKMHDKNFMDDNNHKSEDYSKKKKQIQHILSELLKI